MNQSIKTIIRDRQSVRTYNGKLLSLEDQQRIQEGFDFAKNPFGVDVHFYFLDAKEHGLTSPVIVGTDLYVTAKVERGPLYEVACGYSFEKFCLYVKQYNIGTVMLAATMNRKAFEKAIHLQNNEVMPVVSPVGYPAIKKSMRETIMRKGVKADERLPFETLFFYNDLSQSLSKEKAGIFLNAFEMLRLAPSAVNKQPWRVILRHDAVHFYKKKGKAMSHDEIGDIQKVDIGIALAHFDLTLQEEGINGKFIVNDPEIPEDDQVEYMISYQM